MQVPGGIISNLCITRPQRTQLKPVTYAIEIVCVEEPSLWIWTGVVNEELARVLG